ncbi:MAG TPA: isoleucine--tRNA ligase [Kofleriaceae bacterium]|nr:isoleucine--tRNA ligase [Kofleriaceae bacterium]
MALEEVPSTVDFAALEHQVLAKWKRERTFEQSLARRAGAPHYVFYDGPPFATGLPHYGHVLTSYMKDVVPRYQTMRGYHVPRRWGWDCHGLPVELEVEKELGLASPVAADRDAVAPFNDACRALVLRYAAEWEGVMTRLGRWVDFAGAYRTMDADYTESVVSAFAELHRRGLVYEGQKVVAYCTRCQTPLSNFETRLDDAYRARVELALTVRFPLAGDRASLLAWTTTPWTLPANAALAVHPALVYVRLERADGDAVWLAEAALPRYATELDGYTVRERCTGAELAGRSCAPPFRYFTDRSPVLAAEWVSASDGTGVVHLAPAFGEDDAVTCAAHGVTGENHVRDDGTLDARVGELAGLDVLAANEPVARALAGSGRLFARGEVEHDYPHCWRCDRPLVYRAMPSWYVAASRLRDRLLACNAKVRWVPAELGEKRFADWLANARDWAVSRKRAWGAPVPVWQCERCAATRVVGSRAELEQLSGCAVTDWHRPAVDEHVLACACGGEQRRVADVLDCWFESGAMPFASLHAPFARADEFRASFPGHFVAEYVAQTRGWFYTMLVLSTALFDEPPFTAAVCHGVLLGEDGRKMSKRLRNYPDPMELVETHGSDALRVALLTSGVVAGADVRFSAAAVRDVVRRLHLPWWNTLHLVTAYASGDGYLPSSAPDLAAASPLDRALWSEAEQLRVDVERALEALDFGAAYQAVEDFVTTLSTWYVRLAKPVLWRDGLDAGKRATYDALHAALVQLAVVAAPLVPFLAEATYAALGGTRSVHLEDWPAPREAVCDPAAVAEMRQLRAVVRLARSVREQAGVKHRQPLRVARVAGLADATLARHRELLATELNVKRVEPLVAEVEREVVLDYGKLGKRLRGKVKAVAAAVARGDYREQADRALAVLDERLAPDEYTWRTRGQSERGFASRDGLAVALELAVDEPLLREATARELARAVQDLRKQARLRYGEPVQLAVVGESPELAAVLDGHAAWLAEQCSVQALSRAPLSAAVGTATLELAGTTVELALARA